MTIEELGRRLRARDITAAQVTDDCLARIAEGNGRLNAFILVMSDAARRQAGNADRELAAGVDRGPLHGVPISIKDLIDVQGTPTTAASRVREGHIADHDAPAIARLREAGAVFIGKTNLHEFALGTTNEDSAFGPARHPVDPARSPGGSSGGSAASVAAGMALASIGTDTGGSIRIPAAACGIVGLKATLGEVSTAGVVPLSQTMDHVGPLAQTVLDAAVLYHALAGTAEVPSISPAPINRLRLAVPRAYFCDRLDDDVRRRFDDAVARLRDEGARIEDVEIRHTKEIVPTYVNIGLREAFAHHARTLETMPWRYTEPVRQRLEAGRAVSADDYARAMTMRDELRREVERAMTAQDALVLPSLAILAPIIGAETMTIGGTEESVRALMLRETQLFNMTGHPAIALPCGRTSTGLPTSIQFVGARGQTNALLAIALACERLLARE